MSFLRAAVDGHVGMFVLSICMYLARSFSVCSYSLQGNSKRECVSMCGCVAPLGRLKSDDIASRTLD